MVLTSLAAATGPIPDCDFEQGLKNISALSDQLYGSLNTDRSDGFLLQSLLLTNGKTNIMVLLDVLVHPKFHVFLNINNLIVYTF